MDPKEKELEASKDNKEEVKDTEKKDVSKEDDSKKEKTESKQEVDTKLIKGLFEGSNVEQSKQDQFVSIFEAAVKVESKKLADEKVELVEKELKDKVEKYTEYVREEYATKIDEYSDYVASKFMEENKIAINNGVKSEMFDSLIKGIKTLCEDHGIILPDDKVDVVKEMEETVKSKENELNEIKKEVIALKTQITSFNKEKSIAESIKSLADTEKEKVIALANELVYDETFGTKLSTIVESIKTPIAIANDESDPQFIAEKTNAQKSQTTEVKRRKFVKAD